ncbi:MAG: hypothetical protein OXR73_29505 [Myxococcales bacterium]|nr:hypothetical protein [Myxococcales bacterium]
MVAVSTVQDVRPYFQEHVSAAMRSVDVDTREETAGYLVGLLADFVLVPDEPNLDAPLASVLSWALSGRPDERVNRMRCLGDLALFRCGFFPDQLERRGVDERYAAALGGRAYDAVASGDRRASDTVNGLAASEVFAELAARFLLFAQVLDEVRERTAMQTHSELTRMYTRYRMGGSPRLARRLARRGLC